MFKMTLVTPGGRTELVKLRPNFQKIAQLNCTTNEKRNLSEHDEKNFHLKFIDFSLGSIFSSVYRVESFNLKLP